MLAEPYSPFHSDSCTYHYSSDTFKKEDCHLSADECHFPEPLMINNKKVIFTLNERCKPIVICENKELNNLADTIKTLTSVIKESDLTKWAILTNYLTYGLDYQLIEHCKEIEENYDSHLNKMCYHYNPFHLYAPHQINLEEIQPTQLIDNKVIFYVKKGANPYRVEADLNPQEPEVHYQILNFK